MNVEGEWWYLGLEEELSEHSPKYELRDGTVFLSGVAAGSYSVQDDRLEILFTSRDPSRTCELSAIRARGSVAEFPGHLQTPYGHLQRVDAGIRDAA